MPYDSNINQFSGCCEHPAVAILINVFVCGICIFQKIWALKKLKKL